MKINNKLPVLVLIILLLFSIVGCTSSEIENPAIAVEGSSESVKENETALEDEVINENNESEVKNEETPIVPNIVDGDMKVYFFDVGQGDSIYIKAPNGEDILIDGGDTKYSDDVVRYLTELGVDDIEIMILTHPHNDHLAGLIDVLDNFTVKAVYSPRVTHTTRAYEDFVIAVKNQGLKFKEAKAGVELDIKGVNANFVAPANTYGSDLNNWSSVVRMEYGETSFLFTGDAETKSENDMISSGQNLNATVLKLGHHGSVTSSSNSFLDKVNPKYAIVSAGVGNKYGHPDGEILERMNSRGIEVFRTDLQGAIVASSDGKEVSFNSSPEEKSEPTIFIDKIEVKEENATTESSSNANFEATIDNRNPTTGNISLKVSGKEGATYTATLHFKSKDTVYEGVVGTPLNINIGRASKGFEVVVDIDINSDGNIYKTKTSFTPN